MSQTSLLINSVISSEEDFPAQLRLFETWVFIGPASSSSGVQPCALSCCCLLLHPPPWQTVAEDGRSLAPLFMLYCALGIHVDESGNPEERQSGDGTSFPESPDLSHVGTTAAFHHLADQHRNLKHFALRALRYHIILKVCSYVLEFSLWPQIRTRWQ